MEIEAVLIFVVVVFYLIGMGIRALYRFLTGAARREREKQEQWLEEMLRQEKQRREQEQLQRKAMEEAKRSFEQAVMSGRLPSEEVLAILGDCESEIPLNPKEGVEELLYGHCSFHPMTFADAVRRMQQRQRTEARTKARGSTSNGHDSERTEPITQEEASELLGVSVGCTGSELATAYRTRISQWHPDKLESMASELKDYATRQTARINEAYNQLKQRCEQT